MCQWRQWLPRRRRWGTLMGVKTGDDVSSLCTNDSTLWFLFIYSLGWQGCCWLMSLLLVGALVSSWISFRPGVSIAAWSSKLYVVLTSPTLHFTEFQEQLFKCPTSKATAQHTFLCSWLINFSWKFARFSVVFLLCRGFCARYPDSNRMAPYMPWYRQYLQPRSLIH